MTDKHNRRMRGMNGLTSADIEARLAKKFASPEYAFPPQLSDGTGSYRSRTADAVAMSVWPSRGLHLHGFEIKVSRGDWRHELQQPEKSEAVQRFCHFWWIVTDKNVIQEGDIVPQTWGWMEADGAGLAIRKQAPLLTPEAWSVTFVAALLRGASAAIPYIKNDYIFVADFDAKVAERVAQELKTRDPAAEVLSELRDRVKAFESASGLDISRSWQEPIELGKAVRLIMDGGMMKTLRERTGWQRKALAEVLQKLDALCDEDDAARQPLNERESR